MDLNLYTVVNRRNVSLYLGRGGENSTRNIPMLCAELGHAIEFRKQNAQVIDDWRIATVCVQVSPNEVDPPVSTIVNVIDTLAGLTNEAMKRPLC